MNVCVSVCSLIDWKARASTYRQNVYSYVKFDWKAGGKPPKIYFSEKSSEDNGNDSDAINIP